MRRLSLALSVAALPAQVEHGRLVGQLDDATLAARVGVSVSAQRQGAEGRWARVGADGTFALDLPPGDYAVGLSVHNDCRCQEPERRRPPRVPLLGNGVYPRGQVRIDAGATATLAWTTPRLVEVRGRVVAGGRPVAGVHVFLPDHEVARSGPTSIDDTEPDHPRAHIWRPCCVTDADGAFTFATLQSGRWNVYLRHPEAAMSAGPFAIASDGGDAARGHTLALPEGRVRGHYEPDERKGGPFTAYLFRRALADADPFSHHDLMAAQIERMQGIALRNDRAFEFAWLAAGDYVVRIVGGGALARRIVAHRCLHADGRGVVDLGDLAKAEPIDTALDCGPRPAMEYGPAVSVQALPPDGLAAVFWQSSFVRHGRLDLAGIHPGRYRLQRFEPQHFAGTWGLLGPALGVPVVIEVGADGKVTPARVF